MIMYGVIGSIAAGLATTLGCIPLLFFDKISKKIYDATVGFASGVMLVASFFSLIKPGLNEGLGIFDSKPMSFFVVICGLISSCFVIKYLSEYLERKNLHNYTNLANDSKLDSQKLILLIIAICIHNFPEGLAVGVGFAAEDMNNALSLAIGIGLQNIPEGTTIAMSCLALGMDKKKSCFIAFLSGCIEPVASILGLLLVNTSKYILPFGLGFAAGAMLYVICHEMLPEFGKSEDRDWTTKWLFLGLIIMIGLDFLIA
ncbi:MAG: ZIP family metal transporter [Zetaproteobacteria bacterium]|nr:ZIP family metal transporter [Pseudobdellovibrionaceae bacterium]